jgi:arylsulfatase A-like enzyme
VIVVVVDTLRADAVGGRDGRASATPHLDALGARGLVFTNAVAQSSWTLQSVASLMTGLHSRTHGALGRHDPQETNAAWGVLGDTPVTWAEAAADAGITPIGVSANPLVSRGTNLAQGFETFSELPWDPESRSWATAAAVNESFGEWLRRAGDRRFVAYLHYMEPHDPYTPPDPPDPPASVRPALAKGWIRDLANKVNWQHAPGLSDGELAHLRECYRREVAAWDDAFGTLLELLASRGLADRTIVVVTADHGEEFQEHGRLTHGSHLYDETIRVPLVLAGPGVPVGRRDDQAQGIDLFPTLAHLLALAPPPRLAGRDLLGPAADDRPAVIETSSGIASDGRPIDLVAVRTSSWKLIETPADPSREVYDLRADPGERDDHAERAGAADPLVATLTAWRTSTPEAVDGHTDPALADRLRALGYVR